MCTGVFTILFTSISTPENYIYKHIYNYMYSYNHIGKQYLQPYLQAGSFLTCKILAARWRAHRSAVLWIYIHIYIHIYYILTRPPQDAPRAPKKTSIRRFWEDFRKILDISFNFEERLIFL